MIAIEDIPGFEGRYKATSDGRIWSCLSNKWLKLCKASDYGYLSVCLSKGKPAKSYPSRVHRLVAMTYLSKANHHTEVNHKDKDPTNNRVSNLEWCTRHENMTHQYKHTVYENRQKKVESLIKSGVSKEAAEYALR